MTTFGMPQGPIRTWSAEERRSVSLLVIIGVIVVIGVSVLIALLSFDGAQLALLALTVVVLALFAIEFVVVATSLREPAPGNVSGTETIPPVSQGYGETITLKCGNCGTIFDVQDVGTRPLHHTCPGCGAEGVLREEDERELALPTRVPAREAPKPPAPTKQLRLRCKACATVFSVTDTGERPLRHRCPGCGAAGVVR